MKELNGYYREGNPKKHYMVMLLGRYVADSYAVSPEKAINNVRWNYYISEGIYDYGMEDFDAVEAQ